MCGEGCCPEWHGRRVRGLLHPWILLSLAQAPAHGYELLERLEKFPAAPKVDPTALYRALRALEEEGLVQSAWDLSESGPARRVYRLTDLGKEHLESWASYLARLRAHLDWFLAEYERTKKKGGENNV